MCSYAASDEHSGCESCSGQGMGEAREVASTAIGQGKRKKDVILEAQKEKKSPFCYIDGHIVSFANDSSNKSDGRHCEITRWCRTTRRRSVSSPQEKMEDGSPDLSPLAQSTARSASCSCQSRRIAGTFDPRVSQDVGRQP